MVAGGLADATRPERRLDGRSLLLVGLALAYALATVVMLPSTATWGTTHAGVSILSAVADITAGWGLIAAGLVVASDGAYRRFGAIVGLAGVAWLAADWTGWQDGAPAVRGVAALIAPLFPALMLHAAAVGPSAGLGSRSTPLVASAYVATALLAVAVALVGDPRADATCWNDCTDNVFLVSSMPSVAAGLRVLQVILATGIGMVLVGVACGRLGGATVAVRAALWPILVPGGIGRHVHRRSWPCEAHGPHRDPWSPLDAGLFLALACSAVGFAGGVAWLPLRGRRLRGSLTDLIAALGDHPAPGVVGEVLSRTFRDPDLAISYRLDGSDRWVIRPGTRSTVRPPTRATW